MYTESELLTQIANGNETAFKHFFELHKGKLYNYLLKVTKSQQIADEILIDVFFKIWMGRELITEVQNMDSFLFTVAKNKALDFFKMVARNKKLQRYFAYEMDERKVKESDSVLLENECNQIFRNAIGQLSPKRKEIFILSRERGLTHEQIAQHLNLSKNTVRNTMAESLRTIRHFLLKSGITHFLISILFLFS